uniref:Uncharacterized protein n=1 Tax=Cucumis melo TaxID=3656 RepID=A0A9I9E8Q9_CUCME
MEITTYLYKEKHPKANRSLTNVQERNARGKKYNKCTQTSQHKRLLAKTIMHLHKKAHTLYSNHKHPELH